MPEFSQYNTENLSLIIKKIQLDFKQKASLSHEPNQKNILINYENLESFCYLGEFKIEKSKKFFQIYFRRNFICKEITDFLMYDISKIKEAEEIEFKLRSQFFANIAHEFKTPLNWIIGLIKLIDTNLSVGFNREELQATLKQIRICLIM